MSMQSADVIKVKLTALEVSIPFTDSTTMSQRGSGLV